MRARNKIKVLSSDLSNANATEFGRCGGKLCKLIAELFIGSRSIFSNVVFAIAISAYFHSCVYPYTYRDIFIMDVSRNCFVFFSKCIFNIVVQF